MEGEWSGGGKLRALKLYVHPMHGESVNIQSGGEG